MSWQKIAIGAAAVVGAVVVWRIIRGPLAQVAGGLVTEVGGKTVAEAAHRAALGQKEYANVIAMREQVKTA